MLISIFVAISTVVSAQQPTFQHGTMPAGLMAGVQDCPTNILFSIVATCTSIQGQLPVLVERLRDAIKIQEDPNDFSPSDIAKMRETSAGLCEMADPMLSCLKLLGQCPSLLGSLGAGVGDAEGVLQVMCVNRSLDRYLDCTERNGGMNIRQRYCSQYRNYTVLEQAAVQREGNSLRSSIGSLANFPGISNVLNEGGPGLNNGESQAMHGIAGLVGNNDGEKQQSIDCPQFLVFSGCMASAVKKVCGADEAESMYYVSKIQAKSGSDTCRLPETAAEAEKAYLRSIRSGKPPVLAIPTRPSVSNEDEPIVVVSRPNRRRTTERPRATNWPGETTSFWMPNRLRDKQPPSRLTSSATIREPVLENDDRDTKSWWFNEGNKDERVVATNNNDDGNEIGRRKDGDKNVIVLQLASTPSTRDRNKNKNNNVKVSNEVSTFEWSDGDDEAMFGSQTDSAAILTATFSSKFLLLVLLFVLSISFSC